MTAGSGDTRGKKRTTAERSECGGKQGDRERERESCSAVNLYSKRERCRLQISHTDSQQARYRPESEASTVYFLPAQRSDMSVSLSVLPVIAGGVGFIRLAADGVKPNKF